MRTTAQAHEVPPETGDPLTPWYQSPDLRASADFHILCLTLTSPRSLLVCFLGLVLQAGWWGANAHPVCLDHEGIGIHSRRAILG